MAEKSGFALLQLTRHSGRLSLTSSVDYCWADLINFQEVRQSTFVAHLAHTCVPLWRPKGKFESGGRSLGSNEKMGCSRNATSEESELFFMLRASPTSALIRIPIIGALLAGFLIAFLFAGSPALHDWAHSDSDDGQHQCLATVLHAGACEDTPMEPVPTALVMASDETAPKVRSRIAPSVFLSCRILEHAPPSLS